MLQFKTQCVLNIYIFMYLHTYIFIATDGGHMLIHAEKNLEAYFPVC